MNEYVEYLHEVFEHLGPITARRMFGGYGIYHDGVVFALVDDDTLYLKADAQNRGDFEELGMAQFEFNRNGKIIRMSYYQAPEDIMDDRELAAHWARRAFEAALRSGTVKSTPRLDH